MIKEKQKEKTSRKKKLHAKEMNQEKDNKLQYEKPKLVKIEGVGTASGACVANGSFAVE